MAKISFFGFKLGKDDAAQEVLPSFAPPILDDGAVTITAAAHYGTVVDLDSNYKNDVELITRYREMAMQPEIESAVDDIINEAIIQEENKSVEINLDQVKISPKIKSAIEEEFENILILLNFKNLGQDIFRRFYVDGRLNYNIILDKENPAAGIQELRYTDPRKLSKIREIQKIKDKTTGYDIVAGYTEYYIYSDVITTKSNLTKSGFRIAPDSIISVTSGLLDAKRSIVLSYLHKAIKPLNQLRMIEDATVIYKVSRAPERRIFYIDVGNLPKMKAEQYLKDIMTKYKNKVVYDACLDMNTMIPLLDGRILSLYDIQKEFELGKELWAYSCDPITGKFAPGLISSAGITKFDQKVIRITLDNGKSITCTYDHKFPVWNKGKIEAQDLIIGDSMIPYYTQNKSNSTYQQIFKNDTNKWEFTHREVSKWKNDNDINTLNLNNFVTKNENKKIRNRISILPSNKKDLNNINKKLGYIPSVKTNKDSVIFHNHKITNIEYLDDTMDVGTLGIDKNEIYHDYHTFALDAGIYTCNSTGEVRDDRRFLSMMEDFWLPRRSDNKSTEITTLPSSAAFDDMSMVQYFEKKLYKALSVPFSRLDKPETPFDVGNSDQISRDEVKFDKFINRLRLKFVDLFDQALKVQCYLKGICTEEEFEMYKQNIFYDFQKDNNYAELKEAQILQSRLNLLSLVDPYVGKYYSQNWVQKTVLQMKEDDITEISNQIKKEIKLGLYPDPKLMNDPNAIPGGIPSEPPPDDGSDQGTLDDGSDQGTPSPTKLNKPAARKKADNNNTDENPYYNG